MQPDRARLVEWMNRASAGDRSAFDSLARATQDELYRFALAQGLRSHDAAEAVQEALTRAYRHRRRWRADGDAMAWLVGIVANVVRETRRSRHRHFAGLDPAVLAAAAADAGNDDQMDRLAAALTALPERQREAVVCRYLRRMSVRQTATAMECAEGTVKAAAFAGLRSLRAALRGDRP